MHHKILTATAKVSSNGTEWGLINDKGEYVVAPHYHNISCWKEERLLLIEKKTDIFYSKDHVHENRYNGKYKFIDNHGQMIQEGHFNDARDFAEAHAAVARGTQWGFIDQGGAIAVPCVYERTYDFSEGYAAAKKQGKWGFIDREGRWKILPQYRKVQSFKYGLSVVQKEEYSFVIDLKGDVVAKIPEEYNWGAVKSENLIFYGTIDERAETVSYGVMDAYGHVISEPIYVVDSGDWFDFHHASGDLFLVDHKENGYGYMDNTGKVVIPCKFDIATPFSKEKAVVWLDGEQYQINRNGVIRPIINNTDKYPFDEVLEFSEGMTAVRKKDKWGFINEEGSLVIDFVFNEKNLDYKKKDGLYLNRYQSSFSHGLVSIIRVENARPQLGYIDKLGHTAIPFLFSQVQDFEKVA